MLINICNRVWLAALILAPVLSLPLCAQSVDTPTATQSLQAGSGSGSNSAASPIASLLATRPWEYGVFANGGFGEEDTSLDKFFYIGGRAGKVLTNPWGRGLLRGQFEYDVEVIPLWQAYTPSFQRENCYREASGSEYCTGPYPTGGTYSGISIEPIILRWDFLHGHSHKWLAWFQGAGGVIWTNHKYPPLGPIPTPGKLGTSVFNFTPQFGIGVQRFVKPRQAITFSANAVHISSASLGDANPGVNASVQLSIGYTWWK